MKEYGDFVKACVALFLATDGSVSLSKTGNSFSAYLYSGSVILNSMTLFKDDNPRNLKVKFAGFKAACECLAENKSKDDNKAA